MKPAPGREREAEAGFLRLIDQNATLRQILEHLDELGLPDTWVVGGSLFQTAWNVMSRHAPDRGIKDYDIFYFDPHNCTREQEDEAGRRATRLYQDLGCEIDVRNQARVHTWYAEEFGVEGYPRLQQATNGIDNFLAVCCMLGVRKREGGSIDLYAPFGVDDVLSRVMRPNPLFPLASREAYENKATRWRALWPELVVVPFPSRSATQPQVHEQ